MQARTGQQLRDTNFAHRRQRQLQQLDQMVDEVRVSVDGAHDLDQGRRALLIDPLEPASDRCSADQEGRGGLLFVPAPASLELEYGEPVCRQVAGPTTCEDTTHPSVLDAQFFTQPLDLGLEPFIVPIEAHLGDGAVGAPTADASYPHVGHPQRVQERGLHVIGPAGRQRDGGQVRVHSDSDRAGRGGHQGLQGPAEALDE